MDQAEQILTEAGIRPTAIRLVVLREIIAYAHTFTLAEMEQRIGTIDHSTLFRTLMLFAERKIGNAIDNGSGSNSSAVASARTTTIIVHTYISLVRHVMKPSVSKTLTLQSSPFPPTMK
jgi:Fur family ferric uptake transcriptional regulator